MTQQGSYADLLRLLAFNDAHTVDLVLRGATEHDVDTAPLSDKTRALTRVAALVGCGGPEPTYHWAVASALAAGARANEIVDVLLSIAPIVGMARVVSAAPTLASALGCELDVLDDC
jgi:alkylhydroperoxidase/carboxymuconolactone decarboxylase family protein YurZ